MNQSIETYTQYPLPVSHTIAQNLQHKVQSSLSWFALSWFSLSVQNTMASFLHPTSNSLPSHNMLKSVLASLSFHSDYCYKLWSARWLSVLQWYFRKKTIKLCIQISETMGTKSIRNMYIYRYRYIYRYIYIVYTERERERERECWAIYIESKYW